MLTEFVRLLLHKSSVRIKEVYAGVGLSYHDASVDLFLKKIARARLPREPSVVDEPILCAPGGVPERLGSRPISPILSNQPRYMATASLPSPKNRNRA